MIRVWLSAPFCLQIRHPSHSLSPSTPIGQPPSVCSDASLRAVSLSRTQTDRLGDAPRSTPAFGPEIRTKVGVVGATPWAS
jgi:hypothetical protein